MEKNVVPIRVDLSQAKKEITYKKKKRRFNRGRCTFLGVQPSMRNFVVKTFSGKTKHCGDVDWISCVFHFDGFSY